MNSERDASLSVIPWVLLAGLLLTASICLAWIAPQFSHETDLLDMPILTLVFGYVSVAAIFTLWVPRLVNRTAANRTGVILSVIILTGLVVLLLFLGTPTVLEDDFNRYLWDGAVTASGVNPYLFSPEEVDEAGDLQPLRTQAGVIFERINYPEYSTVYPPVAQAAFAITHLISPFDLDGLRCILFVFELAMLYFVILILKPLGRSVLWCAFYWWHPQVIKEVASSAHMEPILMLPVVVAAYLVLRNRSVLAAVFLTLGAGVKIWPLLLMPIALKPQLKYPLRFLSVSVGIALFSGIIFWPIAAAGLGEESGFIAFARLWNASSAAYLVADWLACRPRCRCVFLNT